MSAAEMHALEKAAMDDPFLADALEGYSKLKAEPNEDIAQLQKRLAARSHGAAVVPIKRNYWWRVAALILLIGGLGTLTIFLNRFEKTALSKNEQQNKASAVTIDTTQRAKDTSSQGAAPAPGFYATEKANEDKPSLKAAKQATPTKNETKRGFTSDSTAAVSDYATISNDDHRKQDALPPVASSRAPLSKSKADTISGRQSRDEESLDRYAKPQGNYLNYFSGKVVDGQNRSIPFATVRMTNANQVAAADQYGNFQFKSRDSVAEISISSEGYKDRYVVMNSNQQALSITLAPLNEKGKLSEVKTKSAGKKEEYNFGDAELNGYVMDAEPVIGWDKYNLYLDSSKKIPANEPRINGDVVVSFKVNHKGELSSFEIEKSMSKAYNNEAIRLVKQGPAWRVIKGKKPKVKVIVRF